jgi:DNA uptake protein ComE-like DNA-binding protein
MFSTRPLIMALISLSACYVNPLPEEDSELPLDLREDTSARSSWDGTPEGIAALDFLNHSSTTKDLLDDDVALDRRAAGNLIAHRDGGDGLSESSDDDLFNSIDEVDSVRWVGPSAIGKIIAYAEANGWVQSGDDLLGTWDKVSFTVNEATETLALVNSASEDELDYDIALNRRAVNSILDARPLTSVDELAGLYYVGTSALTKLKDYSAPPQFDYEDWFTHDEEVDVPDGDLNGIVTRTHVLGVPENMPLELFLSIDVVHDDTTQIQAELVSPRGTSKLIYNFEANVPNRIDLSDFADEDPNGYWTLTVIDDTPGVTGYLWGWAVVACDGWGESCL